MNWMDVLAGRFWAAIEYIVIPPSHAVVPPALLLTSVLGCLTAP